VSLSDAAKEVKFVAMLMQTMGIKVKMPITVRVDNVAAIFTSSITAAGVERIVMANSLSKVFPGVAGLGRDAA
jgi:hypothetical protein